MAHGMLLISGTAVAVPLVLCGSCIWQWGVGPYDVPLEVLAKRFRTIPAKCHDRLADRKCKG